jgi:hypothetical protein
VIVALFDWSFIPRGRPLRGCRREVW